MSSRDGYTRLLRSRYASYGQTIGFTHPQTNLPVAIRMIDMTKGVEIGEGPAKIPTVAPSLTVMTADLTSLDLTPVNLNGVEFTINGVTWQVTAYAPHPSPWGLEFGEIYFLVTEANA